MGADFTTGKDTLALGEGIGIVRTGVGEALIVGDAVAAGLGCALPEAHAATKTATSAATTPKPPCWVINNLRPETRTHRVLGTCYTQTLTITNAMPVTEDPLAERQVQDEGDQGGTVRRNRYSEKDERGGCATHNNPCPGHKATFRSADHVQPSGL